MAEFATGNCARAGGEDLKKRFPMLLCRGDKRSRRNPKPQLSSSFPVVRVRQVPDRALVNRAAKLRLGLRLRSLAQELRSSSPGALGKGARRHEACRRRYHFPCPGCPLNRSRCCTRSRVPPSASLCSRSCGCHFPMRRCALGARLVGAFGPGHIKQGQPSSCKPTHVRLGHTGVNPSRKRLRVRVPCGFAVTG
jgi:hypothetical protein